jgi:hypothetical protein
MRVLRLVIPRKDCGHDEPLDERNLASNGPPRARQPRLVSALKRSFFLAFESPHVSACPRAGRKFMVMSTTTHVIEIGHVTAGIIVAIKGGFRFFAAERAFKSLDLAIFPTIEDANRAAREKLSGQKH